MLNRAFHIIDPLVAIARKARAAVNSSRLYRDTRGAVAIYVAVTGALLIGGGVLAIDVGRMVVVRAEMQNAADAAALSAALQLNGTPGARARAMAVVNSVITLESQIVEGSGIITATITNADFFEDYDVALGIRDVAESDSDAAYVRVVLDTQQLNFVLTGVLELVSSASQKSFTNMTTFAVAEYLPVTCEPTPLMVCDIPGDPNSVGNSDNAGREYGLTLAPGQPISSLSGNFGLLDFPPGGAGIRETLAGVQPLPCGGDAVSTKTGVTVGAVRQGINARFGIDPPGSPPATAATNIFEYSEDTLPLVSNGDGLIGDGQWDPNAHFSSTAHCAGVSPCAEHATTAGFGDIPTELGAAVAADGNAWSGGAGTGGAYIGPAGQHLPTRYQTYLWEIGETFQIKGGKTQYPGSAVAVAAGWQTVNPVAVGNAANNLVALSPKYDNTEVPTLPSTGQATEAQLTGFVNYCVDPALADPQCQTRHRTILVVVVDCATLAGNGRTTITGIRRYARFFLIRKMGTGVGAYIPGELIGIEGTTGAGDELVTGAITGNVRLVN